MHKAIFSADFETQNVILKTKRRGVIFKTKYNEKKDKLQNPKKKGLWLSLGKDTTILKRFATKAEMENYKP